MTEIDLAATLESLTAGYRHRRPDVAQLEVVVPLWWVKHWGRDAVAAAAIGLNCKITAVDTWQDAQDQLSALVFEAGTWHHEPSEGGQHGD